MAPGSGLTQLTPANHAATLNHLNCMADQATNPGGCSGVRLALFAFICTAPLDLLASWTVDMSAASAHLGGPPSYTFSTLAEAQAFVNANKNYGARLVPGGSDDNASGGSGGGGSAFQALSGGGSSALTAQQQLALSAAQAALPLLQQAVHGLLAGPPKAPTLQMPRDQSQIAAQQLYNSGMWYARQNDYANALVEFQKALQRAPGNQQILDAIAHAQHQLDLAAQEHTASAAPPAPSTDSAATALNLIDQNSDSSVADLGNTTKTSVDPAYFKADSPPMADDPVAGKTVLDAQFDELYRRSILEENPVGLTNQQVDAQFDQLTRQDALDDYKRQLDALSPQDLEKMKNLPPHK
jgi:tetratricopeptide (TPR) repeat protein